LRKVLKKIIASDAHEKLAVADAKLGQAIKVICGTFVIEFVLMFTEHDRTVSVY